MTSVASKTAKSLQQVNFETALDGHFAFLMGRQGGKRMDARNQEFGAIDARGRNLSAAIMSGVNLIGALLQDCDLSMADIFAANLSFADLSGGNLSRIDARGSHFDNAIMRDCDLRGAGRRQSSLARQTPPGEQLRGRQAVSARHQAHRHARLVGFLHDRHLLCRRPAATAFGPRQNLALHVRYSHKHSHTPSPYLWGRPCPVN